MDVELIESDDDGVDMVSSKMTLVECRESLKGIAPFIAQDACLGDEDILYVRARYVESAICLRISNHTIVLKGI